MTAELTPASQDYVKVVWSAQEWSREPVTTSLLAGRMGLAPSSVSEAVKKLTAQGLLTHARYGAIELTPAGRDVALAMVRRHRLLETYLCTELGYAWHEVHDEAEILEHAVSDRFVDAIDARLGHPTRDPHGDPIPTPGGDVPTPAATQLPAAPDGVRLVVARISDADPDRLRYLADLGLHLDAELEVRERRDYAGTLLVELAGRRRVDLGLPAAEAVWVARRPA